MEEASKAWTVEDGHLPPDGEPVVDEDTMEEEEEYFVQDDGEGGNEDDDEYVLDLD